MEWSIIWETIKAVVIFYVIFESEPFTKVSNEILMNVKLPKWLNHLLECGWCITFWVSMVASILTLSTTPVAVAMITAMVLEKLRVH